MLSEPVERNEAMNRTIVRDATHYPVVDLLHMCESACHTFTGQLLSIADEIGDDLTQGLMNELFVCTGNNLKSWKTIITRFFR